MIGTVKNRCKREEKMLECGADGILRNFRIPLHFMDSIRESQVEAKML